MSESPFPFAAAPDAADDEVAARPDRRRTVLAVGALAVVSLAAVGVLVLGGSSDDEDLGLGLPPAPPAAPAAAPSATPPVTFPVAGEVRLGRDPFSALDGPGTDASDTGSGDTGTPVSGTDPAATDPAAADPAAADPAAADPAAADPAATDPAATDPGAADPVAVPAAPPAAPRTAPAAEADGLHRLALVRTAGEQSAVFAVDGTEQTVPVGGSFGPAGSWVLLSVQEGPGVGQWTAVLQAGEGDPFDVVTGTTLSLR